MCTFCAYYTGEQTKENEMVGHAARLGGIKTAYLKGK